MHLITSGLLTILLLLSQSCKVNSTKDTSQDNTATKTSTSVKETAKKKKETFPVAEYTKANKLENYDQAIFAGGCFWCTEAVFERITGVVDVISGYSGGQEEYPSYYEVGDGKTSHAEAICIYYDSAVISYETLLDIFFKAAHDPTTLNRQGPDAGEEYRSAIFFKTEAEQNKIDTAIKSLNSSNILPGKIVTQVAPYEEFWVAEGYHQNYYELHPNHSYVTRVSRPKVKKVKKIFPKFIKPEYLEY